MINTVLFDMGGTIEDIYYDRESEINASKMVMDILKSQGLNPGNDVEFFWRKLEQGIKRYKSWSEINMLEEKPEVIWPKYYLSEFGFDENKIIPVAEKITGLWEVTYYRRSVRKDVRETLEYLKNKGYSLGIISNTISLYSVFDVLEEYKIRDYFEDVTLSSITGYRKPHPEIFRISMRQMQKNPSECAYVGDTVSRDIIGAKKIGFKKAYRIDSFLSKKKDIYLNTDYKEDKLINSISELMEIL